MVITTDKKEVIRSREFQTIKYGVDTENLPLLFKVLRTNLYSDLHGSIIREVVSNVVDSHTEANKPDAIGEVEWVNENRPLGVDCQLIIRDFGVGISPERMQTIYGNYLSSTKRGSNDQIGGFGLGSKAPFAYTDSFFVQTIFEEVKYKYLCYIDESQLGAISLLGKEETNEGNGTEIIIPIKKPYEDFNKFQAAVRRQLAYFNNLKFIGFEAPEREILFEDNNCIILKNAPIEDTHIILGNVAYEFDLTALNLDNSSGMSNNGVGIKFEIGELQPTISREGIHWHDKVKDLVIRKINKARKSVGIALSAEINSEKDYGKWYSKARWGTTETFPRQFSFTKLDGFKAFNLNGKDIPIASSSNVWLAGHNPRKVTVFSGYHRRNATVDPDYSAVQAGADDLLELPIYKLDRNLNGRTCLWLFTQHPDGFVAISHLNPPTDPKEEIYYEATKTWLNTLPNFDAVVVPDTFNPATVSNSKDNYKELVKQRKLEGKFTSKRMRTHYEHHNTLANNFIYNMYESKFEDHKKDVIIYGFQEDHSKMSSLAAMLISHKDWAKEWNTGYTSSNYNFLKIGRHYTKQFAMMPNAYYIDNVLALKTPLNKILADIATGFRIKKSIHTYHILEFFEEVNPGMRHLYRTVHSFVENCAMRTDYSSDIIDELLLLCEHNHNLELEGAFKKIQEYFEGAELLRSVNFDMYSKYHTGDRSGRGYWADFLEQYVSLNKDFIRDYLVKAGKAIDVGVPLSPEGAEEPRQPGEEEEEEEDFEVETDDEPEFPDEVVVKDVPEMATV